MIMRCKQTLTEGEVANNPEKVNNQQNGYDLADLYNQIIKVY